MELVRDSNLLLGRNGKIVLVDGELQSEQQKVKDFFITPKVPSWSQLFRTSTYVADDGREIISLNKSTRDVVDGISNISLVVKVDVKLVLLTVHDNYFVQKGELAFDLETGFAIRRPPQDMAADPILTSKGIVGEFSININCTSISLLACILCKD